MENTAGLSERKRHIIRAIVDEYIETAKPVSSRDAADSSGLGLSPATVRKEMNDLTKMGFLIQPHTSAGRVPSQAAYRVYVNDILLEHKLSVQETKELNDALRRRLLEIDGLIADLTKMVSELTNHPAFAMLRSRAYLSGSVGALDRAGYDEVERARQFLAYIDGLPALPAPEDNNDSEDGKNNE